MKSEAAKNNHPVSLQFSPLWFSTKLPENLSRIAHRPYELFEPDGA